MPDHDNQLIAEYDAQRGEEAFAALVRRHINLVFATALRQVGDTGAAEEIAQNVFVALAQASGKLKSHPTLAGWLHRTTLNKSREWLRSELRRHRREQFAASQTLARVEGDSVWSPLAPLLDEALLKLHESDRLAVIMHYMEGQTFQEVGSALGVGEDTARKRVNRCLQQLMDFFQRRGFAVPALEGGAPLFSLSLHTAPAGLAGSVTTAGLAAAHSGASTLTLIKGALKIMAWIKANTVVAVGAAVILAAGTTVVVVKGAYSPKPVRLAAGAWPQTLEELNAWYVEPPTGQNAATFNLQGLKAMQMDGTGQKANLPIFDELPREPSALLSPAVKRALADFLQRNQAALQFFAQGMQYEQSRYPIDLTKGGELALPHLRGVRKDAELCQMAAILDAENGDGKKAGDDVAMTLALARSLKAEPVLMSQLVRVAGIALAVAALNQAVNHTTLPPESLSALAKMFRDMEDYDARGEGFNRGLVGEKVTHMAFLKNRKELLRILQTDSSNGQPDAESRRLIEYVKNNANLLAEQDYSESIFQQFMAARQDPFPDRLKSVSDVIKKGVSEARNQGLLLDATEWAPFDNLTAKEARNVANLRLAMTAIALEQFRASRGNRYPDDLSELVPNYLDAPLLDPFDGKPLRYRKQGVGYVFYSVGPDLKDDGGNRMKGLVFAVVAPPAN